MRLKGSLLSRLVKVQGMIKSLSWLYNTAPCLQLQALEEGHSVVPAMHGQQ